MKSTVACWAHVCSTAACWAYDCAVLHHPGIMTVQYCRIMDALGEAARTPRQRTATPGQRALRQLTWVRGRGKSTITTCQRPQCGHPKSENTRGATARHPPRCPDGKGSYSFGNPAQCRFCDGRHRFGEAACFTQRNNILKAHTVMEAQTSTWCCYGRPGRETQH